MINNKLTINGRVPLRGKISLQSSTKLANFFITLSLLYSAPTKYRGEFLNNNVHDYIDILNAHGFQIKGGSEQISLGQSQFFSDSTYFGELDLFNKFLVILSLVKKGFAEVKENKDFIDFLKYMGFVVKVENNVSTVYNKIDTPRESITFYNINTDYFLIAILAFCLNYEKFSISIADTTYEINLLLEELKNIKFVENISYSTFVNISFNTNNLSESLDTKIEIPKDTKEFVFFSMLALGTNGEIEIEGINPKYLANSLKILSELGAGYDSVSNSAIRIWGIERAKLNNIVVSENISYLDFTKLCLLSIIPYISKENETSSKIDLDPENYKQLIQDLNILGSSLSLDEKSVISLSQEKLKGGSIYMEENKEDENYVRLLSGLLCNESIDILNFNYITKYNSSIFSKLQHLGANINLI